MNSDLLRVNSPNVVYNDKEILASYQYQSTLVEGNVATPIQQSLTIKTDLKVPKLGLMLVGLGGNNGTTCYAGILANKLKMSWNTKEGVQAANYFGSVTQASTVKIGLDKNGQPAYIPFKNILPLVNPNDIVIGGWDISSLNLGDSMKRAKVLDYDLQRQLYDHMKDVKPLPSIYYEQFIAANQSDRADNVLPGSKKDHLDTIRKNIRDFKEQNQLDKVIVLWTATTERYAEIIPNVNDTADNLLAAIEVRLFILSFLYFLF